MIVFFKKGLESWTESKTTTPLLYQLWRAATAQTTDSNSKIFL